MILAHGLGGRTDLPLPTWMVLYGGAVVLLASFAALVILWPRPRWEGRVPGVAVADMASPPLRVLKAVGRMVGLGAFCIILAAAIAGDNDAGANIAPVAVYVTFWVGMTFVSGLVGDLWAVLNPFDTMAAALDYAEGEQAEPKDAERSYQESQRAATGYWPAAAGLLAFVWLELVYPDRAEPRVLAVAIIAYTAVVLVAAGGGAEGGFDTVRPSPRCSGFLPTPRPSAAPRTGVCTCGHPSRDWPPSRPNEALSGSCS